MDQSEMCCTNRYEEIRNLLDLFLVLALMDVYIYIHKRGTFFFSPILAKFSLYFYIKNIISSTLLYKGIFLFKREKWRLS